MFKFSSVLGGPGGRRMGKKTPDERRDEENKEGSELIYDKIIFVVNVFYTQVCNYNISVITDSRSKEEAVTPIVTRAWVIASAPSSAMRGRFFHNGVHHTKKEKTLIADNSLPVSCVHQEVISSALISVEISIY